MESQIHRRLEVLINTKNTGILLQGKVTYHTKIPPLTIHNPIIMRQSKRTSTPKSMPRNQRNRRERKIHNGMQHGIEAIRIRERAGFAFIEVETGAEEFRVVAAGDDCAFGEWP